MTEKFCNFHSVVCKVVWFWNMTFFYFNPTVQCALLPPFLLASSDTFWISNLLLNDGIMVILIIITLCVPTRQLPTSSFISRLTLLLSCAMHFENYPHDEQICRLSMESCKYITIRTLLTSILKGLGQSWNFGPMKLPKIAILWYSSEMSKIKNLICPFYRP